MPFGAAPANLARSSRTAEERKIADGCNESSVRRLKLDILAFCVQLLDHKRADASRSQSSREGRSLCVLTTGHGLPDGKGVLMMGRRLGKYNWVLFKVRPWIRLLDYHRGLDIRRGLSLSALIVQLWIIIIPGVVGVPITSMVSL